MRLVRRVRPSLRRFVVTAAVVGAAVAGASLGFDSFDAHVSRRAAASAWRAYGECLVGEPIAPGDHVAARLGAMDLGLVVATGEPQRTEWPSRCVRHLRALGPLLAAAAHRDARWSEAAELARRAATTQDPSRVDPSLVDALSDALARLALPAPDTTADVDPRPPAPLRAELGREALALLASPGAAGLAADDPLPGAGLELAWASPPRMCRISPGLASARCFEVRGIGDDAQLTPVASDEGAPSTLVRVAFAHDAPAGIVRTDDGVRVSDEWQAAAFMRADGAWWLAPTRDGLQLRHASIDVGPPLPAAQAATLAGDSIVWVGDDGHMRVRSLDRDAVGQTLGSSSDLGVVPPGTPSIALCRAGEELVARATAGERAVTAFRRPDGTWSSPVVSPRADRPAALACHAGPRAAPVSLTWMEHDVGRQITCTPSGCARGEAALGAGWDGGDLDHVAIDVGGRIVAIRHAVRESALTAEPVEAIVARAGSLAELAHAPERVLVADAAHGGVDPASVQAFARGDDAVVIVNARDGRVWGLHLGAAGDASALRVAP